MVDLLLKKDEYFGRAVLLADKLLFFEQQKILITFMEACSH